MFRKHLWHPCRYHLALLSEKEKEMLFILAQVEMREEKTEPRNGVT